MKKNKKVQRSSFPNTRKVLRKQKRQEKKVHRHEHCKMKKLMKDQPKYVAGRFVKRPADVPEPVDESEKKKQKMQPLSQDMISKDRQKEQKEVRRLNSQMERQRRKMLVEANEEEDKMIKKLEKQLGLNKAKNKNNYFADDGLDYLLEICDRTTSEQIVAAEKHLADVENESDFDEDLATVTGKEVKKTKVQKRSKKDDVENQTDEDLSEGFSGDELDDRTSDGSDLDEGSELEDNGSDLDDEEDGLGFGDSDTSEDLSEVKPTKSQKFDAKTKIADQKTNDINSKQKDTDVKQKSKDNTKTNSNQSQEKVVKVEDLSKVFSDDEVSHLSGDDDDLEGFSGDEMNDKELEKKNEETPDVWEDIYGRKRDKEGNVIKEEKGTYVPPHLRNKDSTSEKDLVQLKRQIKSVLNKLSGTNLHWACTSIESLYANNSRHSVNSALTRLWLDATVGVSAAPDRMVAEHAALQAVLHANVATDCGAYLLQELAERFDRMMNTPQPVEDKRLNNLVSCLAHLYSFKMYHANLLYDILARLSESLSEKHIECIVVCLRCVGGVLRKEGPLALRNFIQTVQERAGKEHATDGSRLKFLVEVLLAVKNNNLTKIPNYDPTYTEHLKKTIRSIIRKGNYITPLNIGLEDLLKADERGKWWIVGSAWEGNRPQEEKPTAKLLASSDQKLLELARKQRMNTDVRRSIFCVIMAAEDYMSAFEKLEQLGLRGPQQREIVHVVLACCLQEKNYNPYYAILAAKLADSDRKYQLSFQFSIWDKIKDLDNLTKLSMTNLAQFLVHLIMDKALPLSVLKIIQFSDLTKRTVKFMRQILLSIIMNEDLQSSLEVFHRIAKPPKLHMFRESLRLFIQHFLIKNAEKKNNVLSEKEMGILKERAGEVEKILTMHESKLMF